MFNKLQVNYIVRQGYGEISESEMPEGSSRDNFSWDSICNFDVLAIKQDGNAKIFRIVVMDYLYLVTEML